MPGFDRTGPRGRGPLTGRGLGPCGQGFGRGLGAGFGRGMGRGFGRGLGYEQYNVGPYAEPAELDKDSQKAILKAELASIEAEKTQIEKRIKELE